MQGHIHEFRDGIIVLDKGLYSNAVLHIAKSDYCLVQSPICDWNMAGEPICIASISPVGEIRWTVTPHGLLKFIDNECYLDRSIIQYAGIMEFFKITEDEIRANCVKADEKRRRYANEV